VVIHGYDIVFGSRLLRSSTTKRCLKREGISRAYHLLVKVLCHARFSDAQCGFKAIRRTTALELLPRVQDNKWFADTELLILGQILGCRMLEVPVHWVESSTSTVKLISTALDDIRGLFRMRKFILACRNETHAM
jgi:hypothetical protein